MRNTKGFISIAGAILVIAVLGSLFAAYVGIPVRGEMNNFKNCDQLVTAFENSRQSYQNVWKGELMVRSVGFSPQAMALESADSASGGAGTTAPEYSETNVQVEGVDEADIVKTDGNYIYTITQGRMYYYYDEGESKETGSKLIIVKAYPGEDAEIVSETDLGDFYPNEIFIHDDRLLIFGVTYEETEYEEPAVPLPERDVADGKMIASQPYYRTISLATVQLWDISDREDPEKIRVVDFDGSYLTSRKIGSDVYFVINSYPEYHVLEAANAGEAEDEDIIPVFRDSGDDEDFKPSCDCEEVGYFSEVMVERFVTLASISMDDDDADVTKEVIVGSGQNVYASLDNLYIAEQLWPGWGWITPLARTTGTDGSVSGETTEKTVIHKFSLEGGYIDYQSDGEVPGHILNQFSMDEHDGYFRIATTAGRLTRSGGSTSNNIYVLDEDMSREGEIEDIAPGESIYSARFMGDRAYLVTFKKIDPFFVIDMSVPSEPKILGKLKIPGYSDYMHPYDENHIIGIGKDTVEAEEEWGDFSWYQGVKMAIFDVTDVANPTEMHKVIIGDRGTDSYALRDHKAFLFDRERNLLVIPILLAEIDESYKTDVRGSSYGDYVYQGAYVYDITLEDGFDLRGRVTHVDDDSLFLKSGYYYAGGDYSVKRSLYIDDTLYTLSGMKLKLNMLDDLSEVKEIVFGE